MSTSATATPAQYIPTLTGTLAALRNNGHAKIGRARAINAAQATATAIVARPPDIRMRSLLRARASSVNRFGLKAGPLLLSAVQRTTF